MHLPDATTPQGLFDYVLALIVGLSGIFALYIGAVALGYIQPWF